MITRTTHRAPQPVECKGPSTIAKVFMRMGLKKRSTSDSGNSQRFPVITHLRDYELSEDEQFTSLLDLYFEPDPKHHSTEPPLATKVTPNDYAMTIQELSLSCDDENDDLSLLSLILNREPDILDSVSVSFPDGKEQIELELLSRSTSMDSISNFSDIESCVELGTDFSADSDADCASISFAKAQPIQAFSGRQRRGTAQGNLLYASREGKSAVRIIDDRGLTLSRECSCDNRNEFNLGEGIYNLSYQNKDYAHGFSCTFKNEKKKKKEKQAI